MSVLTDSARLARIRDQLHAVTPAQWSRVYDGAGCFVEARGAMAELVPIARFDPAAGEDEIALICEAPDHIGFLLDLVDRAIARLRPAQARPPESRGEAVPQDRKNFAAECAMKCGEPAFRVFLEQQHGLERPLTDERVAQKVRGLLGVVSRRDLNDSGQAAEAWRRLRADYDAWRRAGR